MASSSPPPMLPGTPTLTRELLDTKCRPCTCGEPRCRGESGVRIACREHPDIGFRAQYSSVSGQLELICISCKAIIAFIQVAGAVPS